jgi:Holliday junction resolvase
MFGIRFKKMKKLEIDSSARLIFEAIQQLGWDADSSSVIDRIKRLELGIPAEDEIAFILSWLGKCIIIHKLDQKQYPPESGESFQVPDLFACFVKDDVRVPLLIEVKSSNKKKLSWKESYFNKLKSYSSLVGLPIIVAWKFYRIWLLVDIDCFKKAITNYHLTFEEAMKHNLLSHLAGDFVYKMEPNVGLHFHLKKENLVSSEQIDPSYREEKWQVRIEQASFVNSGGKELSTLHAGLWPLFISAEPVSEERFERDIIHQSFVIPEDSGMHFAHSALPILLTFFMDTEEKIHWRKHLNDHKFPVHFKTFYEAASEGLKDNFVRYVIHQQPYKIPQFLEHIKKAERKL